jgi:acyl-CoA thioester hydrolase
MPAPAPTDCGTLVVLPEWIDYSGHMNIGYYQLAFEIVAMRYMDTLELSQSYRERTNHALFAVETHISFLREATEGDTLAFTGQLLGHDDKRVRTFLRMHHADGVLAAINEVMYLHVDVAKRRAAPFPADRLAVLDAACAAHAGLDWPAQAGRAISFPEKKGASAPGP